MSEHYPIGTGYSLESIANSVRDRLLSGEVTFYQLDESDFSLVTSLYPELLEEEEINQDAA
jgi:hypothetical protein